MTNLNLSFISKYRGAFMGLAILWIFFYHTGIDILGLRQIFGIGWFGVDIFFFVSGFGLCRSLSKDGKLSNFYKKRLFRIIPTWWFVLAVALIIGTYFSLEGFPTSPLETIYWFSGIGYWIGSVSYEWYVPTLLVFYLLAPLFAKMKTRHLALAVLSAALLALTLLFTDSLRHVYISYSRLPVYILGFLSYKLWSTGTTLSSKIYISAFMVGLICIGIGVYLKHEVVLGLTIVRISIPLVMIQILWMISQCFDFMGKHVSWTMTILEFLGLLSLEIYLVHICHAFSQPVTDALSSLLPTYTVKLTWFAMTLALAYGIHTLITCLTPRKHTGTSKA